MARPKSKHESSKIATSGADFDTLVRKIPDYLFVQMVGRAGLPTAEARELCEAFKELKG